MGGVKICQVTDICAIIGYRGFILKGTSLVLVGFLFFQGIYTNSFGILFAQQTTPSATGQNKGATRPKRILNFEKNKEGFGIVELPGCKKESKDKFYLKITPTPMATRDWFDKDSPEYLGSPEYYTYVKFEKCRYREVDNDNMELYDCTNIPNFKSPDEYWNLHDIFMRLKNGEKNAAICYSVGVTATATAACIVGAWAFAGWYVAASGVLEAAIIEESTKFMIVSLLGGVAGFSSVDAVRKLNSPTLTISPISPLRRHACITSNSKVSESKALALLLRPEYVSGLWGIAIDPDKIMSLSSLINIITGSMIDTEHEARKQIWKADKDGNCFQIGAIKPKLEIKPFKNDQPAASTYVAPYKEIKRP